jgi:hypothetical protein
MKDSEVVKQIPRKVININKAKDEGEVAGVEGSVS